MASENQLRQDVTLTDMASHRQAAESLGLTHSALSQTVSRLEARYGVKLFERVGRRTVPTAYGEVLVVARRSLDAINAAKHEIELMIRANGRLKIGADLVISQRCLARPCPRERRTPGLQLRGQDHKLAAAQSSLA